MSIDPALLLRLVSRSAVKFESSVERAIGELCGLERLVDIIDAEALEVLEDDELPAGPLGKMMGALILDWVSKTYPDLPEPSHKIALWKAVVLSKRKPVSIEELEQLFESEGGAL